jgi:glycine dehydrogenase subunit 1
MEAMLKQVGAGSLEDLFSSVPEDCRHIRDLDLPEALSEWELNDLMAALSGTMAAAPVQKVYVGAGSYEHHIPETVSYLLSRSEFVTSYTPYQPEMSQGTLQAIYEYQTLVGRLLGMEVTNASMYDGATSLAEALLMAVRITGRKRVAISSLIHPHYRQVVHTYLGPTGCEVQELPYTATGQTDLSELKESGELAGIAVQSPNFFGCIEMLQDLGETAHEMDALFIVAFTEPLAYGLLKNPGSQGADIACGEGQSLGIPQSFGGPGLGMFACRMGHVRTMPGRLVGQGVDMDGRRGFVLTLSTREQHIRREKATSNICTNNSLCAVAAAMYMASLGATGIRQLAQLNHDKSEYLKQKLSEKGIPTPFETPTFNEFVAVFPPGFDVTHRELSEKGIVAGLPLAPHYPGLDGHYLLCVTETKTREDMDALVRECP